MGIRENAKDFGEPDQPAKFWPAAKTAAALTAEMTAAGG
jgi:hypothetical protein